MVDDDVQNVEPKVIRLQAGMSYKRTGNREQISCSNENVSVCEETRTIECLKCSIVMDPFVFLAKIAHRESMAFDRYNHLNSEIFKLERRYKNLTKEVERLNKRSRAP